MANVCLIIGEDQTLISETLSRTVNEMVGAEDRSLVLQQITEEEYQSEGNGWSLLPLVQAAQTMPFLSQYRVVVARHLSRFARGKDCEQLTGLLAGLPETTKLVLVWERGQNPVVAGKTPAMPKSLSEALRATNADIINVDPPQRFDDSKRWLRERISATGLKFDHRAIQAAENLVGSDVAMIVGLLNNLQGALGDTARVTAEDVKLYGGEAGSVPIWELDDAIDRGDIASAVRALHRLMMSRPALALLAGLHNRYQKMLRLDGSGVRHEEEAAQLLGMKGSAYPAKKLMAQTRRLGSKKVAHSIRLLHDADLALRGTLAWPEELVMEVLVARLAFLSSSR